MSDVTVTASDVRPLNGAVIRRFDAGGSVNIGDLVYIASDGDVEQADADAAASAIIAGIAVATPDGSGGTVVAAGQRLDVCMFGPVTGMSSMTPGAHYFASTTAGGIGTAAPAGSSSDYVYVVGVAESATTLFVRPFTYDVAAQ